MNQLLSFRDLKIVGKILEGKVPYRSLVVKDLLVESPYYPVELLCIIYQENRKI